MNAVFREILSRGVGIAVEDGGPDIPDWTDDPDKVAYVEFLMNAIYHGRSVVARYNLLVLAVILRLAAFRFQEARRDRRKWRARLGSGASLSDGRVLDRSCHGTGFVEDGEHFSSSSSTLHEGDNTPPSSKQVDLDLERSPLLPQRGALASPVRWKVLAPIRTVTAWFTAWLTYQPRPLPVINRQLPSNGTSLFVLAFLSLNVFLHFYQLPLGAKYFFLFADRCGYVFIVNLPLLYLLAAKTQPLKVLTGRSYEALNIFHRRLGEFMCLEAVVHMVSMLVWRLYLQPEWLLPGNFREYIFHPLILEGFGALLSYELLYFTSLASFRQRWYEAFLASHVILQVVALVFLWLHFETSRPYVSWALAIFLLDRIIWRLSLKSMSTTADITVLDDGETLMLSADWDIPSQTPLSRLFRHNIRGGWRPTDHVFLTVPCLRRTHTLQAHPFTIASAAPPISSWAEPSTKVTSNATEPVHAWMNLLIRSHTGFTSALLSHAHTHSSVRVRLDGPYGSSHALDMLRASDTVILIAGGSGIAVVYPLAEALLLHGPVKQRVRMLWVVHSRSHRGWIPAERLRELVDAGLELAVPEPTAEIGRPDVGGLVEGWVAEAGDGGGEIGVVVSGPDGMNRSVVNACAGEIGRGSRVRIAVEKFGW